MQDDLKKAAQQFRGAIDTAAPVVTQGAPADLGNYGKAMFLDPLLKTAGQAGAAIAGIGADREKEAAAAAEQARKDAMDPSKYQKVRKADGGFAFFDPSGKEIDINGYAKATGTRRADILSDSENPIDLAYENDFNNMNDLAQALYNHDTDKIKAYNDQNPSTKGMTAQDLMTLIIKKYPHMYGAGSYQDTLKNRNLNIFGNNPNYDPNATASTGIPRKK